MSKLPKVGTTIFSVMSKLAAEHNAINLSQGFPNFEIDLRLKEITAKVALSSAHQYAPMPGNPQLLHNVSNLIHVNYKHTVEPEKELLITAGATQGIFAAIHAFVKAGDEVIVLDPAYDCYDPAIVLAGGVAKHVSLNENYRPDWSAIENAFSTKTKILITNNPHNPSGIMWDREDFQSLELLLEKYPDCILISDEVYEFITFEKKHTSAHSLSNVLDRTIIVSSFGKTFHITGWKVGYLWASERLMQEIKKVHQFLVFSVNSIAQQALAEYLEDVQVSELGSFYQQKRDLFQAGLLKSRFTLLPSEGTYFQVASYANISNEDDVTFTQRLTKEFGVAAIPVSVFNDNGLDRKHIRFCFAKTDDTIQQAIERLCKI